VRCERRLAAGVVEGHASHIAGVIDTFDAGIREVWHLKCALDEALLVES
jgi:hypothetical protein